MKKAVFICLFITLTGIIFAQSTEYRDACRKIIYSVNPVDAIAAIDNATLTRLGRFALGIPAATSGQTILNDTDQELFSFLSTVEIMRRDSKPNDFSLYIQKERERLAPLVRGKGDTSLYIKEDSWLDLFQLNLIFAN
jgi:hypothetical protein